MNINKNLNTARAENNDEFYTQLSDIEKELCHYTKHFKDKVVFQVSSLDDSVVKSENKNITYFQSDSA